MAAVPPLVYTDAAGQQQELPLLALYSAHEGNTNNPNLYAGCGWTSKMMPAVKAVSNEVFYDEQSSSSFRENSWKMTNQQYSHQ